MILAILRVVHETSRLDSNHPLDGQLAKGNLNSTDWKELLTVESLVDGENLQGLKGHTSANNISIFFSKHSVYPVTTIHEYLWSFVWLGWQKRVDCNP